MNSLMMLTQLTSPTAAQAASSSNINASNLTQEAQMVDAAQTISGQYAKSLKGPAEDTHLQEANARICCEEKKQQLHSKYCADLAAVGAKFSDKSDTQNKLREVKKREIPALAEKTGEEVTEVLLAWILKQFSLISQNQAVPSSTGDRLVSCKLPQWKIEQEQNQGMAAAAPDAKNAHRELRTTVEINKWIERALLTPNNQGQFDSA